VQSILNIIKRRLLCYETKYTYTISQLTAPQLKTLTALEKHKMKKTYYVHMKYKKTLHCCNIYSCANIATTTKLHTSLFYVQHNNIYICSYTTTYYHKDYPHACYLTYQRQMRCWQVH